MDGGIGRNHVVAVTCAGQTSNSTARVSFEAPEVLSVGPSLPPLSAAGDDRAINVTGLNFGAGHWDSERDVQVRIGSYSCAVVSVFTTGGTVFGRVLETIQCVMPFGLGAQLEVTATVAGQSSNSSVSVKAVTFSFLPPSILSVNPSLLSTEGHPAVTIRGQYFGSPAILPPSLSSLRLLDVVQVKFGGVSECNVTSWEDTELVCSLGPGVGASLPVLLTVVGQPASGPPVFVSFEPPVVERAQPSRANTAGGVLLTLHGSHFGRRELDVTVVIGGRDCPLESVMSSALVCSLPEGSGESLPVVVTVAGQISNNATTFSYLPPVITGVSPAVVPTEGGAITLTGLNFGPASQLTTVAVMVGEFPCGVLALVNHTSLTCQLGAGLGANLLVEVVVTGQSSVLYAPAFRITTTGSPSPDLLPRLSFEPPAIARLLYPETCPTVGGFLLTVQGTNFGPGELQGRIMMEITREGGVPEICRDANVTMPHRELTCLVPRGVGREHTAQVTVSSQLQHRDVITVQNAGNPGGFWEDASEEVRAISSVPLASPTPAVVSSPDSFSYTNPVLSSVSSLGPTEGGGQVLLLGQHFGHLSRALSVSIGGSGMCDQVALVNDSALSCSAPAGTGVRLVTVYVDALQSSSVVASYDVPLLYAIYPPSAAPSTWITMTGSNFGADTSAVSVGLGAAPCTDSEVIQAHHQFRCKVPEASRAGRQQVQLMVDGVEAVVSMNSSASGSGPSDSMSEMYFAFDTPCEADQYQDPSDTFGCQDCPAHSSSPAGSKARLACTCQSGYVGPFGGPCFACPEGTLCAGPTCQVKPGYWLDWTGQEADFTSMGVPPPTRCFLEEACPGITYQLGYVSVANASATATAVVGNSQGCKGQDVCSCGYGGYACADCSQGYYRLQNSCQVCSEYGSLSGSIVSAAVVVVAVVALVCALPVETIQPQQPKTQLAKKVDDMESTNIFSRVTIVIQGLQYFANLGRVKTNWPRSIQTLFGYLSFVQFNMDLFSTECASQCNYKCKTLLALVTPPILIAVVWLVYLIVKALRRLGCQRDAALRGKLKVNLIGQRCIRATMLLLLASFLVVSQRCFDGLNCQPVMDVSGVVQQHRLEANKAVVCYSEAHGVELIMAGLLIYPFGFAVLLAWILYKLARPVQGDGHGHWWSILTHQYTRQAYWCELLFVLFRLVVTCATAFSSPSAFTSLNALLLAQIGMLVIVLSLRPYRINSDNNLFAISMVVNVFTTYLGVLFAFGGDMSPEQRTAVEVLAYVVYAGVAVALLTWLGVKCRQKKKQKSLTNRLEFEDARPLGLRSQGTGAIQSIAMVELAIVKPSTSPQVEESHQEVGDNDPVSDEDGLDVDPYLEDGDEHQ
jgi:hypothetical protein